MDERERREINNTTMGYEEVAILYLFYRCWTDTYIRCIFLLILNSKRFFPSTSRLLFLYHIIYVNLIFSFFSILNDKLGNSGRFPKLHLALDERLVFDRFIQCHSWSLACLNWHQPLKIPGKSLLMRHSPQVLMSKAWNLSPAKINQLSQFQAIDLEPIDFEHFIDEPDLDRPNMEKMFRQNRAWNLQSIRLYLFDKMAIIYIKK